MIIFGPNIARETANTIPGITVDPTGEVTKLEGSGSLILESLIKEYQKLSHPITILNLSLLLDAYPDIKTEYNQPLPRIKLVCALNEERT